MKYIPQLDDTDCGIACLAMIANHYNIDFTRSKLRYFSNSNVSGTTLSGLIYAASKIGLKGEGFKCDKTIINTNFKVPFIAHIKLKENDRRFHFVVIKKINKNYITILDPAIGKKRMNLGAFFEIWTGYIATFNPDNYFIETNSKDSSIKKLSFIILKNLSTFLTVSILTLALIIMGIISSLYFKYTIDNVMKLESIKTLNIISCIVLVMTTFQALFEMIRKYILLKLSIKIDSELLYKYFTHVVNLPLNIFDKRKSGQFLSRIEDLQKVRDVLSSIFISTFMDIIMVVIVGIVLIFLEPTLFMVTIITIVASSLVIIYFNTPYNKNFKRYLSEFSRTQSYLVEVMNGISTIKSLSAEDIMMKEYKNLQNKVFRYFYKIGKIRIIQTVLIDLIDGWSGKIIFWIGIYFILNENFSLGTLLSYTSLLELLISPLRRIIESNYILHQYIISADRIYDILDIPIESRKNISNEVYNCLKDDIEFKNVSFSYDTSNQEILKNINFKIKSGSMVSIVGESGSGKSTIIKLLLKLYDYDTGQILIGYQDTASLDAYELRKKIGYVQQENFLFSGSIVENITLHNPSATLDDVEQVCKEIGAHEFISKLPDGYFTPISERGASLSGGQRQKIALARALLGSFNIIIFDEATSNLDSISEEIVHKAILKLKKTKVTTIIITHRLSTIKHCDNIIVLDEGRVSNVGTHDELLTIDEKYIELWGVNYKK